MKHSIYIFNLYLFTYIFGLCNSLNFTAIIAACTLNMLLQHATVRSIFLLLQHDTNALVPKQHLHSGNVSQLHRVKERSSGNTAMAVGYKTGTPFFISCCTLPKGICWQGMCKSCLVNDSNAPWYYSDIIIWVPVQIQCSNCQPAELRPSHLSTGDQITEFACNNLLPSPPADAARPLLAGAAREEHRVPGWLRPAHRPYSLK